MHAQQPDVKPPAHQALAPELVQHFPLPQQPSNMPSNLVPNPLQPPRAPSEGPSGLPQSPMNSPDKPLVAAPGMAFSIFPRTPMQVSSTSHVCPCPQGTVLTMLSVAEQAACMALLSHEHRHRPLAGCLS